MNDELSVVDIACRVIQAEHDRWKIGYKVLSHHVTQYLQAVDRYEDIYDFAVPESERNAMLEEIRFLRAKLEAHIHKEEER